MNTSNPSLSTSPATQAQLEIVEEFEIFGDWTERYQYLIDLGRKLPPFPEQYKNDDFLVTGCQSKVWIVPHGDADSLRFDAISDSSIVSGLIALLLRVYSGQSATDIEATPPKFVEDIGLGAHLSPSRANGLTSMLKRMRGFARLAKEGVTFG